MEIIHAPTPRQIFGLVNMIDACVFDVLSLVGIDIEFRKLTLSHTNRSLATGCRLLKRFLQF